MGRDEKCVSEQGAVGMLGALSKSLPGSCKPDPMVLVSKSSRALHPPSSFHSPTEKAQRPHQVCERVSLSFIHALYRHLWLLLEANAAFISLWGFSILLFVISCK